MLDRIGSDRSKRAVLKATKATGMVLAASALVVLLIAWSGFLLWLGVQGAKALAHLF